MTYWALSLLLLAASPELRVPDQRPPELRVPDQRPPELRVPDERPPELRVPDQRPPELRVPDQRPPGQRVPDQRLSDQRPPGQGSEDLPYQREKRVAFIHALLEAIRTADPQTVANTQNFINSIENSRCRSAYPRLKILCLLATASQSCDQKRSNQEDRSNCVLIADILVANKLGEKEIIDQQTRLEIMNKQGDYRVSLDQELKRRYAAMVIEFGLSGEVTEDVLASRLDSYCQNLALRRDFAWQYCVAAVAWFIGTNQKP